MPEPNRHTTRVVAISGPPRQEGWVIYSVEQYAASCAACDWVAVAITRTIAQAEAHAHARAHHPELAPEPAPMPPAHGEQTRAGNRRGTVLLVRCWCGLGYRGDPPDVERRFAQHLDRFADAG